MMDNIKTKVIRIDNLGIQGLQDLIVKNDKFGWCYKSSGSMEIFDVNETINFAVFRWEGWGKPIKFKE